MQCLFKLICAPILLVLISICATSLLSQDGLQEALKLQERAGKIKIDVQPKSLSSEEMKSLEKVLEESKKNQELHKAGKEAESFFLDWLEEQGFKGEGAVSGDLAKKRAVDPVEGQSGGEGRLILFLSSSVPVQTVRRYLADMELIHDGSVSVLYRGFAGGNPEAMMKYAQTILVKQEGCEGECELFKTGIGINPIAFGAFGVNAVPALVYTKDFKDGQPPGKSSEGLVFFGEVSLPYFLGRVREKDNNDQVRAWIRRMGGFYGEQKDGGLNGR